MIIHNEEKKYTKIDLEIKTTSNLKINL